MRRYNLVSVPTTASDPDGDELFDPDLVKMPENPRHRRIIELLAVAADRALRPEQVVYRDMNWYPLDGGTALAPDIMVLPAEAMDADVEPYPNSYFDNAPRAGRPRR